MTRLLERVKAERKQDDVPNRIKVNSSDLLITPLFEMSHKETLLSYRKGIGLQIEGGLGQRSIRKPVSFPKLATRTHLFDREHKAEIYRVVL